MDDPSLIARLAAGDQSAAGALYDRYGRQVYSLALRVTSDASAAEDITQDVFLKVWRNAARFDPDRGRVAAWLLHIAYTTSVDLVRVRGKASPSRFDPLPDEPDLGADTAAEAEAAIMGGQVRRALMHLPPEQRQALEMAYFNAMSHSEIANSLNIPLGTVKGRLRLGLDSLRQLLLLPRGKEAKPHAGMPPR